ncbi:MAG: hypothetical protein A2Y60_01830 [Chloroflexi bacterium RBG_13_54_9]|nr:MAG: hypothetical protein A2Y60_01830 [Chloroflexi bacterium RBG_13_54_9]
MGNLLQIIIEAEDKASKELEGISRSIEGMSKQLTMLSGAMVVAGAGALKMVSDARKLNADLTQTGITLGLTATKMRDMALAITDVTFPLQSVTATFEALARAGIKGTENIKDTALAFDALAEATRSTAEDLVSTLVPAFKTFGDMVPLAAEGLDRFTWLAHNTAVDISDFASAMAWVAREGENLDVTMNDMISTVAILESRGITGTAAIYTFRSAVTEAVRTGKSLNDVLGISADQLAEYNDKIGTEAAGATKKYADAAKEAYGFLDRLKQQFSKLSLSIGTFLEPLEDAIGAFTNINIAIIAGVQVLPRLMTAFTLLRAKLIAVGIAGKAMWASLTLGISLAITGIIELIGHWESVVAFLGGPAYRATKQLQQAMKDLGRTMVTDLTTAARSAIGPLEDLLDFFTSSGWESGRRLTEAELQALEAINPVLAEQIRLQYKEIDAYDQTLDAIDREQDAVRKAFLERELLRSDLTNETRLQYQKELEQINKGEAVSKLGSLMEQYKQEVIDAVSPMVTAVNDFFKAWEDGWTGTTEDLNKFVTDFNTLVKGGLFDEETQSVIQNKIREMLQLEMDKRLASRPPVSGRVTTEKPFSVFTPDELEEWLKKFKPLGSGAIVTQPIAAIVGDRGPEAVVPLSGRTFGEEIHNHYHIGYLLGDEQSLRRFARMVTQMQGEDARRTTFGQVNSGYYYGHGGV